MEPRILIIGRKQVVIDGVIATLTAQGRNVTGTVNRDEVGEILEDEKIDVVVLGGGLSDDVRIELSGYIKALKPNLPIRLKDRVQGPEGMVDMVNTLVRSMNADSSAKKH